MSAAIYVQTVKGKHLSIGAPSAFMDAMTRALGHPQPWFITDYHAQTLRGLMAGIETTDMIEALREIIEMAEQQGEVRVWAEY